VGGGWRGGGVGGVGGGIMLCLLLLGGGGGGGGGGYARCGIPGFLWERKICGEWSFSKMCDPVPISG